MAAALALGAGMVAAIEVGHRSDCQVWLQAQLRSAFMQALCLQLHGLLVMLQIVPATNLSGRLPSYSVDGHINMLVVCSAWQHANHTCNSCCAAIAALKGMLMA